MPTPCNVADTGRRFWRRLARALAASLVIGAAVVSGSTPAIKGSTEYDVKAVFLLNFARFVEWPASAFANKESPLVICILGNSPIAAPLRAAIKDENVGGRRLVVAEHAATDDCRSCHLLFVSQSQQEHVPVVLTTLRRTPVLTVGESPRFCESGGMMNFTMQEETVRFEMNPRAAQATGLHVSAKLLKLARTVETVPSP